MAEQLRTPKKEGNGARRRASLITEGVGETLLDGAYWNDVIGPRKAKEDGRARMFLETRSVTYQRVVKTEPGEEDDEHDFTPSERVYVAVPSRGNKRRRSETEKLADQLDGPHYTPRGERPTKVAAKQIIQNSAESELLSRQPTLLDYMSPENQERMKQAAQQSLADKPTNEERLMMEKDVSDNANVRLPPRWQGRAQITSERMEMHMTRTRLPDDSNMVLSEAPAQVPLLPSIPDSAKSAAALVAESCRTTSVPPPMQFHQPPQLEKEEEGFVTAMELETREQEEAVAAQVREMQQEIQRRMKAKQTTMDFLNTLETEDAGEDKRMTGPRKVYGKVLMAKIPDGKTVPLFDFIIKQKLLVPGHVMFISSRESVRFCQLVYGYLEEDGVTSSEKQWYIEPLVTALKSDPDTVERYVNPADKGKIAYRSLNKFLAGPNQADSSGGGIGSRFSMLKFAYCNRAITREFLDDLLADKDHYYTVHYNYLYKMFKAMGKAIVTREFAPTANEMAEFYRYMGEYPSYVENPYSGLNLNEESESDMFLGSLPQREIATRKPNKKQKGKKKDAAEEEQVVAEKSNVVPVPQVFHLTENEFGKMWQDLNLNIGEDWEVTRVGGYTAEQMETLKKVVKEQLDAQVSEKMMSGELMIPGSTAIQASTEILQFCGDHINKVVTNTFRDMMGTLPVDTGTFQRTLLTDQRVTDLEHRVNHLTAMLQLAVSQLSNVTGSSHQELQASLGGDVFESPSYVQEKCGTPVPQHMSPMMLLEDHGVLHQDPATMKALRESMDQLEQASDEEFLAITVKND